MMPTVLVRIHENSEIAQTEVLGPVLSILRYQGDDDEAIPHGQQLTLDGVVRICAGPRR